MSFMVWKKFTPRSWCCFIVVADNLTYQQHFVNNATTIPTFKDYLCFGMHEPFFELAFILTKKKKIYAFLMAHWYAISHRVHCFRDCILIIMKIQTYQYIPVVASWFYPKRQQWLNNERFFFFKWRNQTK